MTVSKFAHWLFFLMILIPLSVDNVWSFPVGHYHLRIQYLGAAGLALLFLFQGPVVVLAFLKDYLSQTWVRFFLAMGAVGAVGTYFSVHQSRSVYFLFWAMGTLIGVPLLVRYCRKSLGVVVFHFLTGYLALQSLVIFCDFFLCFSTRAQFSIARVMTYNYFGGFLFCRPHAWYQEPGYFCGFALIVLVMIRMAVAQGGRRFYFWVYFLGLLAVLMTFSRMGLLGVALLLLLELGHLFSARLLSSRNLAGFALGHPNTQVMTKKNWIVVGVLLSGLAGGLARYWPEVDRYFFRSLLNPSSDPSFENRYGRLLSGLEVFKRNPIVGAGPGAAGAYLVEKLPDSMFVRNQNDLRKNALKNDPFSLSLFLELLSEWGGLGFLFFFLGLSALLHNLPRFSRWRLTGVLVIIYTATQTLARFDLWWAIASLMEFGVFCSLSRTSGGNDAGK